LPSLCYLFPAVRSRTQACGLVRKPAAVGQRYRAIGARFQGQSKPRGKGQKQRSRSGGERVGITLPFCRCGRRHTRAPEVHEQDVHGSKRPHPFSPLLYLSLLYISRCAVEQTNAARRPASRFEPLATRERESRRRTAEEARTKRSTTCKTR